MLNDPGFESRQGEENFLFSKNSRLLLGPHTSTGILCRGKAAGTWSWPLSSIYVSAEVKNELIYTSVRLIYLQDLHKDNFNFT